MAKALLICPRRPGPKYPDAILSTLARMVTPDNIRVEAPRIAHRDGVTTAVFQPSDCTLVEGASVCLGALMRDASGWQTPGARVPDGSYALLRASADSVELVADAVGSRTIWYAYTDDVFIASSSQRAIIALLGDFSPNRHAFAWLLSSGTLGPSGAWDRRLRVVPPGTRIVLDRSTWRIRERPATFDTDAVDEGTNQESFREGLERSVDDALARFDLDYSKWVLPLSGGFDSRGLLLSLQHSGVATTNVRCVTWGRRAAPDDKSSDAYIASELARTAGVQHRYFETDGSTEPCDVLIDRFVVAGEGRVASISGYLDGFKLWKTLHEEGVSGIIRGDEAFGWHPVRTAADVMRTVGLHVLEDFYDERTRASFDLPEQEIPPRLRQQAGETLAAWRDRLYREFRVPAKLAALTDLKCSYVEVANPLLASSVVSYASALPDQLRTDKRLWRESVRARSPKVGFAKRAAITPLEEFLRDRPMLDLMADELGSSWTTNLLGPGVTRLGRNALEAERRPRALNGKRSTAAWFTDRCRHAARRLGFDPGVTLNPLIFAFRAVLIVRTCDLLRRDGAQLRPQLLAASA